MFQIFCILFLKKIYLLFIGLWNQHFLTHITFLKLSPQKLIYCNKRRKITYLESKKNLQKLKDNPKTFFPRLISSLVKYDLQLFSRLFFEPTVIQNNNVFILSFKQALIDNYVQYFTIKQFRNNSCSLLNK